MSPSAKIKCRRAKAVGWFLIFLPYCIPPCRRFILQTEKTHVSTFDCLDSGPEGWYNKTNRMGKERALCKLVFGKTA